MRLLFFRPRRHIGDTRRYLIIVQRIQMVRADMIDSVRYQIIGTLGDECDNLLTSARRAVVGIIEQARKSFIAAYKFRKARKVDVTLVFWHINHLFLPYCSTSRKEVTA